MNKEVISEKDWREALQAGMPSSEPPDDNWVTIKELLELTGYNKRWIQYVVQQGRNLGNIRDPIRVRGPSNALENYWYGPEVAQEFVRRRGLNQARPRKKKSAKLKQAFKK